MTEDEKAILRPLARELARAKYERDKIQDPSVKMTPEEVAERLTEKELARAGVMMAETALNSAIDRILYARGG